MKKPKRLFDFLEYQLNNPLDKSINTKYDGKWVSLSTTDFFEKVQIVSRKLIEIGIKKGDKIALISTQNRTEWCIVDNSILQIGGVTVPIYPTISEKEFQYVLNHSESKICFVSDKKVFDKIHKIMDKTKLKKIYSFDEFQNCSNWNLLFENDNKSLQCKVNVKKKEERLIDENTIFFEKWNTKLKNALKNPKMYNKNIDDEFYNIEETWKDTELTNKMESKWSSNILITNTPLGNVYMYYDVYKLGFCYYSDNYIPNILLNALTMKYVLFNSCLDLYTEEKYLDGYNNEFLYSLKKYNEVIVDKNKNKVLTSDVFIKRNKVKKEEKKVEKKVDYFNNKYIYKGKFNNISILNKPVIQPTKVTSKISTIFDNEEDTRLSYKDYKIELKKKIK